jgi:hypothetical protein
MLRSWKVFKVTYISNYQPLSRFLHKHVKVMKGAASHGGWMEKEEGSDKQGKILKDSLCRHH